MQLCLIPLVYKPPWFHPVGNNNNTKDQQHINQSRKIKIMEGMYDNWHYIPFEKHDDNYPTTPFHTPNRPVPSRRRPIPSPFTDGGYYHTTPTSRPIPSPFMDGDGYHTTPASRPIPSPFMDGDGYHTTPASRPIPSPFMDGGGYPASRPVIPKPAKQVVSIPINFRPTRSDYAVKIQKAFRGFRIRKNVSKIVELKRGVDEVERDLMDGETVELIIRDDRHRLKVSETLMALLLKLDSVGGLNDAVRVCRKAVIRKAILLQERIDSLAASRMQVEATAKEDKSESQLGETLSEIDENAFGEMQIEKDNDNDASEAWECVDDGRVDEVDNESEEAKQGWLVVEEDKNKVVLEKMAEDNRRLFEMIGELCNKNDNQTRLIQSLSKRVEQLEQAMNDRINRKMDKKKKKQMMMLNTLKYS